MLARSRKNLDVQPRTYRAVLRVWLPLSRRSIYRQIRYSSLTRGCESPYRPGRPRAYKAPTSRMNRRSLFGVAGLSLAGLSTVTTVQGDKAYVTGSPQCGVCKWAMPAEFIDGRPLTWCVNERCERYETRYVLPMTVLERA